MTLAMSQRLVNNLLFIFCLAIRINNIGRHNLARVTTVMQKPGLDYLAVSNVLLCLSVYFFIIDRSAVLLLRRRRFFSPGSRKLVTN